MSLKLMPGSSHTIQISQNSWKNMNIFLTNSCLNFKPPRNPLLKLDNTVTHLTLHKLRSHWHGSLWLSAMQRRTGRDWHSHWTCWMPQGSVCRIWCSQLPSDYLERTSYCHIYFGGKVAGKCHKTVPEPVWMSQLILPHGNVVLCRAGFSVRLLLHRALFSCSTARRCAALRRRYH